MKAFFTVCCISLVLGVYTSDHDAEWENFKMTYGKQYDTFAEEQTRKEIFHNMLQYVNEHNNLYRQGKVGFMVAINKFADMTSEEFNEKMTGMRQPAQPHTLGKSPSQSSNLKAAPDSIDWRDYGYVTPVKDQGQCGASGGICAAEALEGQNAATTGSLVSLSSDQIADCTGGGCNGLTIDVAYQYIVNSGGLCCASSFVFSLDACQNTDSCLCATCSGYVDVEPSGDESALKEVVGTIGPVSASIDASRVSFQLYSSGIYYEPSCSSILLDHCILIAGYGNESGQDYWLVKNSWGTSWGEQGYIRMARNKDNNCGIATDANYPIS